MDPKRKLRSFKWSYKLTCHLPLTLEMRKLKGGIHDSPTDTQDSGGHLKPLKLGMLHQLEQDGFSVCMVIKDVNDILNPTIHSC